MVGRLESFIINNFCVCSDERLIRTATLPPTTRQLDVLGLRLSSDYLLTLSCQFPGQAGLECGRQTVRISVPDLLVQSQVFRRLDVARSWAESEAECRRGGGHLLSLGHSEHLETLVLTSLPLSDIWTGGNICPDSPGTVSKYQRMKNNLALYKYLEAF